ncbi:tetratricopeptide repeat protein [Profundibacterium mesophilum]|uniref:Uncharacterized protein n=1 Tax=Profundibacterium mesophilum KAUST100406-0324 TaxID=1037889 RepID=A0A921NSQ8_9RHOB|nr:tetratricopeptide repeat protein [Profundibacterium mesophilum]KAF0675844.1 hypothetical protein PMES_01930 [Profundibacterium mesophilum KAUST100406-0324]
MTRRENVERQEFAEERASLWKLTLGPVTWAVHFAASYSLTAVWCAKLAAPQDDITLLRLIIGAGTIVALVVILLFGLSAWRQWNYTQTGRATHAFGDAENRHEFLGHAATLLCGVSFIGTLYTAIPVLVIGSCT